MLVPGTYIATFFFLHATFIKLFVKSKSGWKTSFTTISV